MSCTARGGSCCVSLQVVRNRTNCTNTAICILKCVSLYRQLLKDYDHYCLAGFWFATMALPLVLAKKEDALGQQKKEDPELDPKEAGRRTQERIERSIRNEPQIKVMVAGGFLETLRRGAL